MRRGLVSLFAACSFLLAVSLNAQSSRTQYATSQTHPEATRPWTMGREVTMGSDNAWQAAVKDLNLRDKRVLSASLRDSI